MAQDLDAYLKVTRRTVLEAGTTAAVSLIGHPQFARAAGLPDVEPSSGR
jgi:hypothetical protein